MTPQSLSEEEKKALLGLARSVIASRLKAPVRHEPIPETERLASGGGAFVTLHKQGALRGCIGRFTGDGPLPQTIEEMALAAAFEDPRFPALKQDELPKIDLEISVLSPLRQAQGVDEIEVGRHGIYIIKGYNRGVLLPQVATEQGWDRNTFLEHTCLKAGLDRNCWKDPETEIFIFSAEIFGEKESER